MAILTNKALSAQVGDEMTQEHGFLKTWLWLQHCCRSKASATLSLLTSLQSPDEIFSLSNQVLQNAGFSPEMVHQLKHIDHARLDRDIAWFQGGPDRHILTYDSPDYPDLLKEIANPPLALYVQGDMSVLGESQIAMVGTRKPSSVGRALALDFAQALAEAGLVVTSGLALGVDGCAHQGALNGRGKTVAVLAHGLDSIYPTSHRRLASKITDSGVLISEFAPGTPPLRPHFPQRNRIISGLARGVLVVEAALKSGSLITARHALEQNREVYAIPGSVANLMAQGCHHLIKQGAKLVGEVNDILEDFGLSQTPAFENSTGQVGINCSHLDKEEQKLLDVVGYEVTHTEEIVSRSGLNAQEVARRLLDLQFQGFVQSVPGGYTRAWRAQNERECA